MTPKKIRKEKSGYSLSYPDKARQNERERDPRILKKSAFCLIIGFGYASHTNGNRQLRRWRPLKN